MPEPIAVQRAYKQKSLEIALKNAGLSPAVLGWDFAGEPLGYRNRLRLKVGVNGCVGFFNPEKAIPCPVLEPSLRTAIAEIVAFSQTESAQFKRFAHVEVRAADADGRYGLYCVPQPGLTGPFQRPNLGSQYLVGVAGEWVPSQRFQLTAQTWCEVPLGAFMQINTHVNQALVQAVVEGAQARGIKHFADVYAGCGNFTLPLLAVGLSGCAVEIFEPSAQALKRSAVAQGFACTPVLTKDAQSAAQYWAAQNQQFELVVVDPPRAGLKSALVALGQSAQCWVAYSSCNIQSLARDLHALSSQGFMLEEVRLFDMFPHTQHAEVLTWLVRGS